MKSYIVFLSIFVAIVFCILGGLTGNVYMALGSLVYLVGVYVYSSPTKQFPKDVDINSDKNIL